MNWTSELPSEPGWYWYFGESDSGMHTRPVALLVEKPAGELRCWQPFMDYTDPLTKAHFPGWWAGPVIPLDMPFSPN